MQSNTFQFISTTHLALTQYHRWYQIYERPINDARFGNQLDILADDVVIESQLGISKGKEGLRDRLKMFDGWLNAHHVGKTEVKPLDAETLSLEADILYQNIRPDQSKYSYTLRYSTILKKRANDLPVFTSLKLIPTGPVDPPLFTDAYPANRALSFMHYWLYCIETAGGKAERFRELLADSFQLHLSTTRLTDSWEKFEQWIASISERVKMSGHTPKNFQASENPDQAINVSVDFEWQGISVDDKNMIAETHHEWILENNLDERFARMKQMKVVQTIPFQVV